MFIDSETDPHIHTHPSTCSLSETHSRVQLRPSDSASIHIRSATRIRTTLNTKQMQSGTKPTLKELDAKLEPLHQKWLKKFTCIYGPLPSKLPPLQAINHTIQLINPDAQYSSRPPRCSVALLPLLCEKTQCYIQAGWWKPTHGKNCSPYRGAR